MATSTASPIFPAYARAERARVPATMPRAVAPPPAVDPRASRYAVVLRSNPGNTSGNPLDTLRWLDRPDVIEAATYGGTTLPAIRARQQELAREYVSPASSMAMEHAGTPWYHTYAAATRSRIRDTGSHTDPAVAEAIKNYMAAGRGLQRLPGDQQTIPVPGYRPQFPLEVTTWPGRLYSAWTAASAGGAARDAFRAGRGWLGAGGAAAGSAAPLFTWAAAMDAATAARNAAYGPRGNPLYWSNPDVQEQAQQADAARRQDFVRSMPITSGTIAAGAQPVIAATDAMLRRGIAPRAAGYVKSLVSGVADFPFQRLPLEAARGIRALVGPGVSRLAARTVSRLGTAVQLGQALAPRAAARVSPYVTGAVSRLGTARQLGQALVPRIAPRISALSPYVFGGAGAGKLLARGALPLQLGVDAAFERKAYNDMGAAAYNEDRRQKGEGLSRPLEGPADFAQRAATYAIAPALSTVAVKNHLQREIGDLKGREAATAPQRASAGAAAEARIRAVYDKAVASGDPAVLERAQTAVNSYLKNKAVDRGWFGLGGNTIEATPAQIEVMRRRFLGELSPENYRAEIGRASPAEMAAAQPRRGADRQATATAVRRLRALDRAFEQ